MSDDTDRASDYEQISRDSAINATRKNILKIPALTGFCLWCEAKSIGVYCDVDCRIDHEKFERMKR
jgi:hypothetical protein